MALATITIELQDEDGRDIIPAPLCSRVEVESEHIVNAVVKQRTAEVTSPVVPNEQITATQALVLHTDTAGKWLLGGQLSGGIDVLANSVLIVWRTSLAYYIGANVQFQPANVGDRATLTGWVGGSAAAPPDGSGYGEGGYGEGGFGA